MSETTSTTGPMAPSNGPASGSTPPPDNRKLMRILWTLVAVAVLAIIGFGVYYYLTQRIDSGPTQVERVVATAEEQVRANPNDVSARLALAAAYLKNARTEDARAQFQEVLKADAANRSALLGLGGILYEQADFSGAKEKYTTAIKSASTGEFAGADVLLQEAYYYRAMSELGLKDYAAATQDLQKALVIDQADADAWYALGTAQMNSGDPKNATKSFQQALLFVPTGWCEPYDGLTAAFEKLQLKDGVTYAGAMSAICKGDDSGTPQEALTGLTSGDFKVPALLGLGLAAEADGDVTAATKWYGQVLEADPGNISANAAIARISTGVSTHGSNPTPTASAS